MRDKPLLLRLGKASVVMVLMCGAILSAAFWRSAALKNDKSTEDRQRYVASLREGLSEIQFASATSSRSDVGASIESLASFVHRRSGVDLGEAAKTTLAKMEGDVLKGRSRSLSVNDVSATLVDWIHERISTLTDQELDRGIETLRGFDSPDLPSRFKGGRAYMHPRANIAVPATEKLATQIRSFRDQAAAGDEAFSSLLSSFVRPDIEKKAQLLIEALPERIGAGATASSQRSKTFTPIQAVLLAYSFVSDDNLLTPNQI
jgi:hypothetical protein